MSPGSSRARQGGLSTVDAFLLVVANMVGTGIFITSGFLARDLGSAWTVLSAWLMGGLLALCGADVYAELGAMLPRAGGEYVYLSRAFGPSYGFLSGWVSLWVGFSAPIAASATACALYFAAAWPGLSVDLTATLVILALSLLHIGSVQRGARVQGSFAALKVLLLVGFTVLGLTWGEGSWDHFALPTRAPTAPAFAASIVLVSFAYSGWNAAAYVAGELRDPARSLPRALLAGTCVVVLLYLMLNVVLFFAAPPELLGREPEIVAEVAAQQLFGDRMGRLVSLAIGVLLLSSVSAMIMTGPRVTMAMAEDGRFPSPCAYRSRGGAPWFGIVLHAGIATAMVLTSTFEALLTYVGFTLGAFAALTVVGAVVLRVREPSTPRPYRAVGWPLTPALFLALSAWTVIYAIRARPWAAAAGLFTLLSGGALHWLWQRRAARSGP